jgi:hypothetical protein
MRRSLPALLSLACLPLIAALAAGCGGDSGSAKADAPAKPVAPHCPAAWKPGWQALANRIHAPVYCPTWMPEPLTGQIAGHVNYAGGGGSTLSVSPDRSYLASVIWAEPGSGELHVNIRGYPGRTRIPLCIPPAAQSTHASKKSIPCFSDPHGTVTSGPIHATVYTVNQGADQWHVLFAWHAFGGLYTVSQHVAEPLTYEGVNASLRHILRSLVVIRPAT